MWSGLLTPSLSPPFVLTGTVQTRFLRALDLGYIL